MTNEKVVKMFGLSFNACTLEQATELIVAAGESHRKGLVDTPNVDHLVQMDEDKEMRQLFEHAMFSFADGMPLVWFSKLFMQSPLPERVTGADLLPSVAHMAADRGVKLFFLGGNPGVAEQAATALTQLNPGLQVVGAYSPPFGFEHDEQESTRIVTMINESGADILFVGVGAPKQEKWAGSHLSELHTGPVLGVGASFDFAAGTVKRAPLFFQRSGLEWLWRLLKEPTRMWERYIIRDSRFVRLAFIEWRKIRRRIRRKSRRKVSDNILK